ncbi:MAG: major capsid protein [Microviridae sp.]|nr:MAG: major capsid protein [Microviridae sp.]
MAGNVLSGLGAMNRTKTSPIPVQRTTRASQHRVLTSLPAGKMVPIAVIPLLREDSISSGSFTFGFEMNETVELLMNAVNVRVMAYLVPNLALDRFDGLDSLNKSYEGVPLVEGGPVTPWFEMGAAPIRGGAPVLEYMGKHYKPGAQINTSYLECYNQIWNFRAKNRSADIPLRQRLDATLAPAFWDHQSFAHIVPDFDQAVIDGEVALNVVNSKMPVGGLGLVGSANTAPVQMVDAATGTTILHPDAWAIQDVAAGSQVGRNALGVKATGPNTGIPDVWAELQDNGITVSLSNIEMARKTQAFARLRQQYQGHSDEYIIDLLMDGITLPDQIWKQPILLADRRTVFGMSKRYASDADNLTESVVNGATYIDVRFSVPRCNSGGVVMLVAEIAPEQLFERQQDVYLHANSVDSLPQFLRDTLDPEKVEVVTNEMIDIDHSKPLNTFGYGPLNHRWAKSIPQIGGKFYRPEVDAAFDEDRQRIWAVETVDPVLSKDFYLCTTMHYKPFVVTDLQIDPFECLMRGQAVIRGNTVFGGLLVEASNNYDKVMEEAPTVRIDKTYTGPAQAAPEPVKPAAASTPGATAPSGKSPKKA